MNIVKDHIYPCTDFFPLGRGMSTDFFKFGRNTFMDRDASNMFKSCFTLQMNWNTSYNVEIWVPTGICHLISAFLVHL